MVERRCKVQCGGAEVQIICRGFLVVQICRNEEVRWCRYVGAEVHRCRSIGGA